MASDRTDWGVLTKRLIGYLRRRGSRAPEDHAQEAIRRFLRREGEATFHFLRYIADNVLKSAYLSHKREQAAYAALERMGGQIWEGRLKAPSLACPYCGKSTQEYKKFCTLHEGRKRRGWPEERMRAVSQRAKKSEAHVQNHLGK